MRGKTGTWHREENPAHLALAAFQHAYIWVHWYCVEAPDINFLYRKPASNA